ncbi:hypothetical protein GALMADRAFT_148044 [Galerina marginata CBS 339.88]|uniref:DUF6533 domain-containing protein n=1 Tax=Galerina marginata (strain CBS 339.88) TaxID=685588 RepID=A0A067SEW7_GALM3|nr:hypothetical protein GALMADRAFT_148044 [Galerina marginata CBS 339.88]
MSDFASLLNSLVDGLWDIRLTHYSHLAAGSVIIFDQLITLDEEIELIWGGGWSLAKILFVMVRQPSCCYPLADKAAIQNRYYPLAAVIFNNYGAGSQSPMHQHH